MRLPVSCSKGTAPLYHGFETCSRLFDFMRLSSTIIIGILLHQWTTLGIAILLWAARFVMQLIVFRKTAQAFGERKFCALLPVFDFQPIWNGVFKPQTQAQTENEFMRKIKENETRYTLYY